MKILFVTSHHRFYGANRSMLTIIKYLQNKGYEVTVLTPFYNDLAKNLEKNKIECIVFPYYPSFMYYKPNSKHLLSPFFGLITLCLLPILIRKLRKINPDLIYSNSSAENLGIVIAKIFKIKHILHVREFLSLDYNLHFWGGNKRKRNYIDKSDGVLFVSKTVAKEVMINNITAQKHLVVYNGFPIVEREPREKINLFTDKVNLCIVGTINDAKGQLESIDYCRELLLKNDNLFLNFYGDGDDKYIKKVQEQVKKYNLSNKIIFHGYVDDPNLIYNHTDILLTFAKCEGFGRVTVEAMLRHIPVIGFNSGGTTELIDNRKNGYLFNDKDSFNYAMNDLFLNDNYYKISSNAYSTAFNNFNAEKYCKKVEEFIQNIYSLSMVKK